MVNKKIILATLALVCLGITAFIGYGKQWFMQPKIVPIQSEVYDDHLLIKVGKSGELEVSCVDGKTCNAAEMMLQIGKVFEGVRIKTLRHVIAAKYELHNITQLMAKGDDFGVALSNLLAILKDIPFMKQQFEKYQHIKATTIDKQVVLQQFDSVYLECEKMEHNAGLNKDWKRRVLFSLRQYFGVRRIGTVSHWTTSKTAAIREKIIAGDYVAASSMMQDLLQLADDGNKVKMQYLLAQLTDYIAINECISIINREIQKYLLSDVDL